MQRGSGDGKLKKVSRTYDPYTTARRIDCKVTFEAVNSAAQKSATAVSVFDQSTLSDLSQLMNGSRAQKTFASCEPFATFLNGKYSFLPDDLSEYDIGYISDGYSDENCENASSHLTVSFPEAVTLAGFTIAFEPESYATEIEFSVSSGSSIVVREKIKNDSGVCTIEIPLVNVTKINLIFSRTRYPHTHVRVSELTCGIIKEWDKKSIINASFESEADIYSEAFSSAVASISVDNSSGSYNAINRTVKYVDLPARSKVTFTAEGGASFSQVSQLKDGKKVFPIQYATCEPFETFLDGSYHFLPDVITDTQKTGFISATVSDQNGVFENPPKISASFSAAQSNSGFEIYFDKYFATKIRVSLYNGENLIISQIVANSKKTAKILLGAENYNKAVFEFLSTSTPKKCIKIAEIDFLKSADGWVKYLTESNPISASFIVNGEKIDISRKNLFFKEFSSDNDNMTANFSFCDRAEFFDKVEIKADEKIAGKGILVNSSVSPAQKVSITSGKMTLQAAVERLLSSTGVSAKYFDGAGSTEVYMWIASDSSLRSVLLKLAQAAMCLCWIDTDGYLCFGNIKQKTSVDTINSKNRYSWNGEKLANFVDCVILDKTRDEEEDQTYTAGSGINVVTIDNEFVQSGQAVADWLLAQYQKRSLFEVEARGNPALDIGDTISLQDISREYQLVEAYGISYEYDGGLKSTIKAVKSV